MIIGIDIDGCLIDKDDKPRKEIIALLKALSNGNVLILWSGGGADYAKMWARRLKIADIIDNYFHKTDPRIQGKVDLAIDDQKVKLGKLNLKV